MMNQSIKRGLIFSLAFGIIVVPLARAEALYYPQLKNINLPKLNLTKVKNTEEFCSKFTDTADRIGTRIDEQQTKIAGFISEHKDTLKENRDARDAELKGNRDKTDQRRNEWYGRLEAKADTDAKKDAVVKFKQTVDTAVDTRQKAVDDAIFAFRKGVDDAISGRKNSMQSTRDAFKVAIDAAVAKVKTDCDNGESTATIRSNFRTSLKAAREKLNADKKDVDTVGKQVKALADVRRKAVEEALAQFQTTLEAAITDLKKAFGE